MFLHKFGIAKRLARLIGWPSTLDLLIRRVLQITKPVKIRVSGIKNPLYARPATDDLWVLLQVFGDKEYSIAEQLQARSILDLGGNSGYTAVYFANLFPNARIVTLEPDGENHRHLLKNVRPYSNIASLHAAVWDKNDLVTLADPSADSSSRSFEEPQQKSTSGELVSAYTIKSISMFASVESWDLIKMDVEGAEGRLLENAVDWIGYANAIAVELHDCCRDQASENLRQNTMGWHLVTKQGETHWGIRHKPSSPS